MNILLLRNYNPYLESSASGNRFSGLIDGICREGHQITLAITGGLKKKGECLGNQNKPNLNIIYLSKANHYGGVLGRLNTYFFEWFNLLLVKNKLKRLVSCGFDIVWLTNNDTVMRLYKNSFKEYSGKLFIELNEFNDIYKEEKDSNYLQRRKAIKVNKLFIEAVNRIDLFAVMTNTLMKYYKSMAKPESKFMLLPMTVDLNRFRTVPKESIYKKPYIAFTGTMANHKDGVDVLIRAFAIVNKKYPNYHLYLAGPWHYDVAGQDVLIQELDLENKVHRLGLIQREQIPSFVCNASLLALSRPDSHQAQGGFPTKLGEYLATGNPVCVTKVGEISNYLKDNESAFLAEPGNVDSFADAMDRALSDETNASLVGSNGRKVAEEQFNVETQAKRLLDFLVENLN